MNIFQRQLLINNKSLVELPDLEGERKPLGYYGGTLVAPQRVSAEEFEQTMCEIRINGH